MTVAVAKDAQVLKDDAKKSPRRDPKKFGSAIKRNPVHRQNPGRPAHKSPE